MNKLLVSAIAAAGLVVAPANAATVVFKGNDQNAFTTTAVVDTTTCGTTGTDVCTPGDAAGEAAGLSYDVAGVQFTVFGFEDRDGVVDPVFANRDFATVIQDIEPGNSGLGVLSTGELRNGPDDQVQSSAGESLFFDFSATGNPVRLSNFDFNAGADRNCANPGGEGPCGLFDLYIDGVLAFAGLTAVDNVLGGWIGTTFEFVANDPTDPSGFVIAAFDVQEVPIPGALPLLLSGIAGLGFAARRKKAA